MVSLYYDREQVARKQAASAIAQSLATSLSAQFDLILLPMFALAVDASTDAELFSGTEIIDSWPVDLSKDPPTHRIPDYNNRTVQYTARFEQIASQLHALVNTSSSIMNMQLAPLGVVGFIHPLASNSKAIGHDLLRDPARVPDTIKTIKAQTLVMAGPVPLVQGGTMMVARLPVFVHKELGVGIDTRDIPLIGEEVKKDHRLWGFAVLLINFQKLLQDTRFEAELENNNMRFNLTRVNRELQDDGVTVLETRKVVGASSPRDGTLPEDPSNAVEGVEVEVEFHEEKMTLTVTCPNGCDPDWKLWAIALTTVGSLVVSMMVLVVLVLRAQHRLLLEKMMPRKAIQKINRGKQVIDEFKSVSIFFSDIVGFTNLAGGMSPIEVMRMLNDLYQAFDQLAEKHKVYKVETIGDAYMVVGGAPDVIPAPEAAFRVASFALDCLEAVKTLETSTGHRIQIRCGVHSGNVVAGVVGTAMPRYCFFGDTVNTASRMESTSTVGRLQVSSPTCGLLQTWSHQNKVGQFKMVLRGKEVEVKGKGAMETYWVERTRVESEVVLPSQTSLWPWRTNSSGSNANSTAPKSTRWGGSFLRFSKPEPRPCEFDLEAGSPATSEPSIQMECPRRII